MAYPKLRPVCERHIQRGVVVRDVELFIRKFRNEWPKKSVLYDCIYLCKQCRKGYKLYADLGKTEEIELVKKPLLIDPETFEITKVDGKFYCQGIPIKEFLVKVRQMLMQPYEQRISAYIKRTARSRNSTNKL